MRNSVGHIFNYLSSQCDGGPCTLHQKVCSTKNEAKVVLQKCGVSFGQIAR